MFSASVRCGVRLVSVVIVLVAAITVSLPAQGKFPPDSFTNLKVLPEDIETRALINTMRGFALGLGVRCEFCHVGEPGQPLSAFDFAADKKKTKLKAREMLKMVRAINDDHLAGMDERSSPPIDVTCVTCHHGNSRPVTIQHVMLQTIEESGPDSAIQEYRDLREEYYGSFTYDFTEFTLIDVASQLGDQQEATEAIAVLNLNLEFFPESANSHTALGQAQLASNDTTAAKVSLEKALELAPNNRFVQRLLSQIGGG